MLIDNFKVIYFSSKINLCLIYEEAHLSESSFFCSDTILDRLTKDLKHKRLKIVEDELSLISKVKYCSQTVLKHFIEDVEKTNFKLYTVNDFYNFRNDISPYMNIAFGKCRHTGLPRFLVKDFSDKEMEIEALLKKHLEEIPVSTIKALVDKKSFGFTPICLYSYKEWALESKTLPKLKKYEILKKGEDENVAG